jgi:hypothetical protein
MSEAAKRYTVTKMDWEGNVIAHFDCDELPRGNGGFIYDAPRMSISLNHPVSSESLKRAMRETPEWFGQDVLR